MRRRERHALAAQLVEECEAFLLGHYAETLASSRASVPVWAWTNLLAHGGETDLRGAASTTATGVLATFADARARLAAHVLEAAGTDSSLAELQSSVLAPLELRLAGQRAVEDWDSATWFAAVWTALRHRHSRRP